MHNKSVEFFDTQFQKQVHAKDYALNPFELQALDYLKGSVLDLGCGLGNLSLEAGRRGHRVLGVDASPAAVDRINRDSELEHLPVRAIQANMDHWRIEGEFDSILLIGLLSYFPRQRAFELLQVAQDHLAPGGRMVVNVLLEGTSYMELFHGQDYHLFSGPDLEQCFLGWQVLASSTSVFEAPGNTCKKLMTLIAEK